MRPVLQLFKTKRCHFGVGKNCWLGNPSLASCDHLNHLLGVYRFILSVQKKMPCLELQQKSILIYRVHVCFFFHPEKKLLLLMAEIWLTTWDVSNPVNNGISTTNLHWCRISGINSSTQTHPNGFTCSSVWVNWMVCASPTLKQTHPEFSRGFECRNVGSSTVMFGEKNGNSNWVLLKTNSLLQKPMKENSGPSPKGNEFHNFISYQFHPFSWRMEPTDLLGWFSWSIPP